MSGVPIDSPEPRGPRAVEPRAAGARASTGARGAPLATALEQRELLGRLLDAEFMLEIFRRELGAASERPFTIRSCGVKPAKTVSSRKAIRDGRSEFVYRLELELEPGVTRELVLLGLAPVAADFPGPELERRARELGAHPAAAPFRHLVLRLAALPVGLLFFPLDPALPALAEITGPDAPRLLAPHLAECRAGARLASSEYELRHYKPGERAVLRVRAGFTAVPGAPAPRRVYVKLFSDEHGAKSHGELCALWAAARDSRWLRVPEPLGYDAERRMLVLAEVPGGRALAEWIHCLEHAEPLPPGVDRGRLRSCILAAARALAALQHCVVRPVARRAFGDVLASLRKDRELLVAGTHAAPPGLVARALALVARLEAAAPLLLTDEGAEALVPSHGGARHKQTVGDEHGLTFVDWDGFCLASPALDPATFLTRLEQEPSANPGCAPELAQLANLFRAEFLALAPAAARPLPLYEALVLTEQVLRSFRRSARSSDTSQATAGLAAAAEACLARAERPAEG